MLHRTLTTVATLMVLTSADTQAATSSYGRLLVPGPSTTTETFHEIHDFDLRTRDRTTFPPPPNGEFPQRPLGTAMCPDGLLYVALLSNGGIYKLDPATGETVGVVSIPTGPSMIGICCLPSGHLLIHDDEYPDAIKEYTPDGNFVRVWTDELSLPRHIQVTPLGTVAFLDGHPGYTDNRLVEYDLDGTFLREVIPSDPFSDGMYSFVFASDSEILVSHYDSNCIRRWNWTEGTYDSDFVCDPSKISSTSCAIHPMDGSVYCADGESECIWAWDSNGSPLYGGEPLGCYDGEALYVGELLVFADSPIPTLSEWGVVAMVLLVLTAGTLVFMQKRRATRA